MKIIPLILILIGSLIHFSEALVSFIFRLTGFETESNLSSYIFNFGALFSFFFSMIFSFINFIKIKDSRIGNLTLIAISLGLFIAHLGWLLGLLYI